MKWFLVANMTIALFFWAVNPVWAGGDELVYTQAITLPYQFQPIDFSSAATDTEDLDVDLVNVDFINQVGSIALTLFSILDSFMVLGIFVVLMLAIAAVFWLWSFVTETPSTTTLKIFDAAEVGSNIADTQLELQEFEAERAARLSGERYFGERHRAIVSQRQDIARFRRFNRAIRGAGRSLRNPFR